MNVMNPQTAAAKRKTGDLTLDLCQIVRNFTGSETDDNKKSVLQKLLEPKAVDKSERDARKILQIAKRIARGESVTPEEKELLRRLNPQLAQMAELARKEGERLRHALRQAASKEEQQTIIGQAYQHVADISKKNPQFGELLGEAVKAAIQKAQKSASKESQPEQLATSLPAQAPQEAPTEAEDRASIDPAAPQSDTFPEPEDASLPQPAKRNPQDALMDQFFPEEWVSMLNCQS